VQPKGYADIFIPVDMSAAYEGEPLLNIDFVLKKAEPLMEAGQTIAYEQLRVVEFSYTTDNPVLTKRKIKVKKSKDSPVILLEGNNMSVAFDKSTGFMCQYVVNGQSFLGEGGVMKPNFWRAVTDNDMGAGLQRKYKAWRTPALNLTELTAKNKTVKYGDVTCYNMEVTAKYDMPDVKATLTMTYLVNANGSIKVTEDLNTEDGAQVGNPLRFGMVMQMPYGLDNSQYYGRGPVENYPDRKFSQRIGIYKQTADEQFWPYVRPQETGTKTDIRWWKQLNAASEGLHVQAEKPFCASALHYDMEVLDDGDDKEQRHSPQMPKSKYTNLFIDGEHAGVGGIDTWSPNAEALAPYRVQYGDRTFTFTLQPTSTERAVTP
jgi:beta-galactosidase